MQANNRRVFDCFTFFNELDLLELRLNTLDPVVDHFVIAEARETFTGRPKPLIFAENRDRFSAFLPKIRHLAIDSFPDTSSTWARERFQRNHLARGLDGAQPDDVVLISDVDEITRPEHLAAIRAGGIRPREVCCFQTDWFVFFMNLRLNRKWEKLGPRAARMADLIPMDDLRGILGPHPKRTRDFVRWIKSSRRLGAPVRRRLIKDGGWHFSWLGGLQGIATKGSSISTHAKVDASQKSTDWARDYVRQVLADGNGHAVLARDDPSLPRYLTQNPERFAAYLTTAEDLAGELQINR